CPCGGGGAGGQTPPPDPPRKWTTPAVGSSSRLSSRRIMVLPAPDGPTSTVMPSSETVSEMPRRIARPSISSDTPSSSNNGARAGQPRLSDARALTVGVAGTMAPVPIVAGDPGRRSARAVRGTAERTAHALARRRVLEDAPDGPEAVAPPDLLALGVGAAAVADPHLVDTPFGVGGNLGRHLGFHAESVLLEVDGLDDLAPGHLVAGLHVGEVQ